MPLSRTRMQETTIRTDPTASPLSDARDLKPVRSPNVLLSRMMDQRCFAWE
jgi:hypothetical protein